MKQWAVKLTLDYGLADHAHKENQTLVNGKEVPFHPQSLHPRDPFLSPGRGENLCRQSCSWWHWGSWGILSLSLFLKSGASPSEELKLSRLQGGRIGHDGWWEMTPTEQPIPWGPGACRRHRTHLPSEDIFPTNSCLPFHHYWAGLIFVWKQLLVFFMISCELI